MEQLTIPLITIASLYGAWAIWITLRLFQSETKIAVGDSNHTNLTKQIEEVKEDIEKRVDKFEMYMNSKFDKVFEKIDQVTKR